MKPLIRRISRALLPQDLRLRLHYFRRHQKYLHLPIADLEYSEDNLHTVNAAPFLADEQFQRAYARGVATGSWQGSDIRWRAYVACWAATHAAKLPGDFVECGVNRGGLAHIIVDYTGFARLNKRFFLIDTFSGLVPEYLSKAEREKGLLEHYAYYKDNSREQVAATFSSFPNVQLIQGAVPDVLPDVPAAAVSFLSLDMNSTMPEIRAAEHFWERMVPSAVLLLDDYTQKMHSEQRMAFDQFAAQREARVLALPTGQGIILKT